MTDSTTETAPPKPKLSWDDVPLDADIRAGIDARGYTHPTPVQAEAVPAALTGVDLLVRSETGSGKTAAFMIPTMNRIPANYGKAACIVLCPTRELAIQVAEEAKSLIEGKKDLRVVTVYGGARHAARWAA